MRILLTVVVILGFLLAVLALVLISWVLPVYLVWQGGWWGIAGLALYIIMMAISRITSKIIP